MERSTVLTKIQTYLIVTVFTILIWLYAEGENVKSHEMGMYVQFVAPPGRELVIDLGEPQRISARFRCATSQLAQIKAAADKTIRIELHSDDQNQDPYQEVALAPLLSAYQPISDLGVTILETTPATVRVRVEPLVTRRVPVVGVVEGDVQLASPVLPDVTEADVRMPVTRARMISDSTRLEARVGAQSLVGLDVNVQHTLEVPLSLPDALRGPNTSISPQTAKVSLRIRDLRANFVIPIVPVYLVGPPTDLARYDVALDEDNRVLRDVELVGPSDVIDRIRKREIPVYAELLMTTDDLEGGTTAAKSKQVYIRVPAGVTVATTPGAVNFTVTREP